MGLEEGAGQDVGSFVATAGRSLSEAGRVTWGGEENVSFSFCRLVAPSLMGEPWSPVLWEPPEGTYREGEFTFLRNEMARLQEQMTMALTLYIIACGIISGAGKGSAKPTGR